MRDLINALEKLVGVIAGIVIGILAITAASTIGFGFRIAKFYPGGLDGFTSDSGNNWKRWRTIGDNKDKKTESEEN